MMDDDESVVNLSRSQALHSQYSHINTNKYFLFGVTLSCKPTFLMTHANLGRPISIQYYHAGEGENPPPIK